jgi:SAM-dependent methyltransferase
MAAGRTYYGKQNLNEGRIMKTESKRPEYGNWVSAELVRKMLLFFLIFGLLDAALWILVAGWLALKIILAVFAAFFFTCVLYFCRARYLFSENGGDVQCKIVDQLISRVDWDGNGTALDVGCGSAALTVKLAKKYPRAKITGVDYWGGSWGYSKKRCEENCGLEGVGSRTAFIHASASKLPFEDDSFDLVVSNLTFHEVRDTRNKRDVVKESLRVVKKGGRFVFQDLFLLRSHYRDIGDFVDTLKAEGIREAHFVDTSKAAFIPKALKLPFMVGAIGILYGVK